MVKSRQEVPVKITKTQISGGRAAFLRWGRSRPQTPARWPAPRASLIALAAAALATAAAPGCGGDSDTCSAYKDDPPGADITVRFKNMRAEPIFLGEQAGCGDIIPFSVHDSAGKEHPWVVGGCGYTCEALQSGSSACPAICAVPPVFRIDPGGQFDLVWKGRVVESAAMPEACWQDKPSTSSAQCDRLVLLEAGDYTITGEAFTEAVCDFGDPSACTCAAGAEGSCRIENGTSVKGTALSAMATLTSPSGTLVELVFP
jgi:hypothetical protein